MNILQNSSIHISCLHVTNAWRLAFRLLRVGIKSRTPYLMQSTQPLNIPSANYLMFPADGADRAMGAGLIAQG